MPQGVGQLHATLVDIAMVSLLASRPLAFKLFVMVPLRLRPLLELTAIEVPPIPRQSGLTLVDVSMSPPMSALVLTEL